MLARTRLSPYARKVFQTPTSYRKSLNLYAERKITTTVEQLPTVGVKKFSYGVWLKTIAATGAVGVIAYHLYHWYYMFPVQTGITGNVSPALEPMDEYQAFLEKLKVSRHPDRNREVVLFGDQGVGKSMAVSHILQSEQLKKWYLSERFSSYLPRALTPPYLKERPWFLLRYQGSLDDPKNTSFKNIYLEALKNTKDKISVNISPDAKILKLFFDAETIEGLLRTASRVTSAITGLNFSKEVEQDKQRALHEFKIFLEEHPGWVIILDDIQCRDGIHEFLPTKGGTIIYTTNMQSCFGLPNEKCVEFNGFTQEQAKNFINHKLRKDTKTEDINQLLAIGTNHSPTKKESYNPLLLDQICSVIVEDELSIVDYLKMFNTMPIELFSRDRGMQDHLSTVKSLELTLKLLKTNTIEKNYGLKVNLSPEEKLLFIITSFASVSISDKLVKAIFCSSKKDSSVAYAQAKGKLIKYRLVKFEEKTGNLSMHPLFHKIFREIFTKNMKDLNYYNLLTVFYHWIGYKTLIDHQLEAIAAELTNIGLPCVTELTRLDRLSLHSQALEDMRSEFNAYYYQNKSAIDHLTTLGIAYSYLGHDLCAKNVEEKSLNLAIAHYQTEAHVRVANTQQNLAGTLERLGDYLAAKVLYEKALATTIAHYQTEAHIRVAETQQNLANTLEGLGDYLAAKVLYEKALATTIAHYKTEAHVRVANTQQNLAGTLEGLGDYLAAKALYEKALATKIAHYKTEAHIHVAETQQNLANTLEGLGDHLAAKALYEKALATKIAHYKTEAYVSVAETQQNLAGTLGRLGDYSTAKALYEKALATMIAHYQTEAHVRVAVTQQNLADTLGRLGDDSAAKALYEKALATKIAHYPTEAYVSVAETQQNLANTLGRLGDYSAAKALYEKALATMIAHYETEEHVNVAIIKYNLASLFKAQQKNTEALSFLKQCELTFKTQPGCSQYLSSCLKLKQKLENEISATKTSVGFFSPSETESSEEQRKQSEAPKKS